MTSRLIAIAAAVLLHLFAVSLAGQTAQQTLSQPTPQTRQRLTKALQDYREKQDLHGEALTLLQLGIAEAGLGDIDGARSNLTEAVKKMRAQNDSIGAWLALISVSQLEVALRHFSDATPHLEKALTVLNEAKASTAPFNLDTFKAFGAASGFSLQLPQGVDESVVAAMKPLLIQFSLEPVTHDLYGSVLTQVGQFEKAEAELKAAAAGSIYSQGMYDFSIESHFGDLRVRQQRYDEARAHYVKALNASSKTAQSPMGGQQITADIYGRLARLETVTGHPEEAKRWSEKARDLAKSGNENR
ncbi:MAG TPA: tetratricopeptide repeat protein [Thermoanaerobaculia bacterium]